MLDAQAQQPGRVMGGLVDEYCSRSRRRPMIPLKSGPMSPSTRKKFAPHQPDGSNGCPRGGPMPCAWFEFSMSIGVPDALMVRSRCAKPSAWPLAEPPPAQLSI